MIRRPEAKAPLETRRVTRFPAEGLLDSPPDSIRTRLWRLSTDESDWDEVLAVWRAVASKHQEINDCKRDIYALQDRLESLQREMDDLTWPARLSDCPNNWRSLSSSKRNRLLQQHRRSTAWILLHSPNELGVEIQRQFWGSPDSELRRDPTMLRLCLKKNPTQLVSATGTRASHSTGTGTRDRDYVPMSGVLTAPKHPPRILLRAGLVQGRCGWQFPNNSRRC